MSPDWEGERKREKENENEGKRKICMVGETSCGRLENVDKGDGRVGKDKGEERERKRGSGGWTEELRVTGKVMEIKEMNRKSIEL